MLCLFECNSFGLVSYTERQEFSELENLCGFLIKLELQLVALESNEFSELATLPHRRS